MTRTGRALNTRRGAIPLPAYVPVTTFGGRYPLDDLVRPYLPRLADAMTRAFGEIASVPKEQVWIVFQDVKRSDWAMAGTLLSEKAPS